MNSTFMKIALAYIAGIATYALFQNYQIISKVNQLSNEVRSEEGGESDSSESASQCACANDARYNVSPIEDSQNFPITDVAACRAMVGGASPSEGDTRSGSVMKGAWFSKVTLDLIFCNKPDANGIFVYRGTDTEGQPTFIVEAERTNKIRTVADGTSTMYYSRAMCPMICGACGM
jgi:hypothetical protein